MSGARLLCGLLCVALAGCSAATPESLVPSAAAEGGEAEFTAQEGAVRGLVIDQSLAPVANATATLQEDSKEGQALANATSGIDGRFVFGHLAPRTYRVTVKASGFAASTQLVQII